MKVAIRPMDSIIILGLRSGSKKTHESTTNLKNQENRCNKNHVKVKANNHNKQRLNKKEREIAKS